MLLIAHNSEHRKSCSNYNLRRIPQPFGFAPAAAFPIMFRHCLLPLPTEATELLLCISSCRLPEATRGRVGVSGFWFGSSVCRTQGLRKERHVHAFRHSFRNGIRPRLQQSVLPNDEVGNGRRCRALEEQPQLRVKPFATCRREGVKVQKSRHDPVSEKRCTTITNPEAGEISPHSVSCPGMKLLKSLAYQQVTEPPICAPSSRGQSDLARP